MKQETLQLTGGNTKNDRRELDFYPTPPEATVALMRFLNDNCELFMGRGLCTVWEPACGDLAMSKVIESFGHTVISTDIITGTDFLNCDIPVCDAIITNPPFATSAEFIKRALSIAPVVAMLLKSQYWHAKKRLDLFNNNRPTWILPLTWRPDFLNGAKGGAPTMDVAWTVWSIHDNKQKYQPLEKPI